MYLFHIFTVSHISPFIYNCEALFCFNTSVWYCCISLLTIFHRNAILIILTSFFLNASLMKFLFPTFCTFCWIASQMLKIRRLQLRTEGGDLKMGKLFCPRQITMKITRVRNSVNYAVGWGIVQFYCKINIFDSMTFPFLFSHFSPSLSLFFTLSSYEKKKCFIMSPEQSLAY